MKFELIPVDKIPESNKRRGKKKLKYDELEIEYMNRITGRDTRPKFKR